MREIKKYKDDISSTQNAIGYTQMFKDGVCWIDDHRFSKTIQFFDTNYQLAEFEEQNGIFSKYCDLINYFDNTVTFQLTFEKQNRLCKISTHTLTLSVTLLVVTYVALRVS